jgi:hypothetical protein
LLLYDYRSKEYNFFLAPWALISYFLKTAKHHTVIQSINTHENNYSNWAQVVRKSRWSRCEWDEALLTLPFLRSVPKLPFCFAQGGFEPPLSQSKMNRPSDHSTLDCSTISTPLWVQKCLLIFALIFYFYCNYFFVSGFNKLQHT